MLETIREFGLERLDASDEAEAIRRRLAAWCLRLAEGAELPSTAGSMAPGWITRLEAERPNLRAAITRLLKRGEAAVVLRLLAATADYWVHRYNYAEISSWANAALGGAPEASAIDRSAVHGLMVFVDSMLGDHDAAVAHAQRGLEAARAAGDAAAMGAAQYNVGLAWEHGDDDQRAAEAYAQAVTLLEAAGETGYAAWAQADWADKLVWLGDLDTAVPLLDAALERLRSEGPSWGVAMALGQRGFAALRQGDARLAARLFAQGIAAAQAVEYERASIGAVAGLAGVALSLG
jgi:tetratricopeptide (TPR) repeat protein